MLDRAAVKAIPGLGPLLSRAGQASRRRSFRDSASYWEQRYAAGGNSGEGSYGELVRFKAGVLNDFVAQRSITSVLELGCGDGNQLSLATYPQYVGLDVSATAIDLCTKAFAHDRTRSFFWYDPARFVNNGVLTAELALSLDVIYHLVEDEVFERYLSQLFDAATRFVAIYSSDLDARDSHAHVRHRAFTPWITAHRPDWELVHTVANPIEDRATAAQFFFYSRRS